MNNPTYAELAATLTQAKQWIDEAKVTLRTAAKDRDTVLRILGKWEGGKCSETLIEAVERYAAERLCFEQQCERMVPVLAAIRAEIEPLAQQLICPVDNAFRRVVDLIDSLKMEPVTTALKKRGVTVTSALVEQLREEESGDEI